MGSTKAAVVARDQVEYIPEDVGMVAEIRRRFGDDTFKDMRDWNASEIKSFLELWLVKRCLEYAQLVDIAPSKLKRLLFES